MENVTQGVRNPRGLSGPYLDFLAYIQTLLSCQPLLKNRDYSRKDSLQFLNATLLLATSEMDDIPSVVRTYQASRDVQELVNGCWRWLGAKAGPMELRSREGASAAEKAQCLRTTRLWRPRFPNKTPVWMTQLSRRVTVSIQQ